MELETRHKRERLELEPKQEPADRACHVHKDLDNGPEADDDFGPSLEY